MYPKLDSGIVLSATCCMQLLMWNPFFAVYVGGLKKGGRIKVRLKKHVLFHSSRPTGGVTRQLKTAHLAKWAGPTSSVTTAWQKSVPSCCAGVASGTAASSSRRPPGQRNEQANIHPTDQQLCTYSRKQSSAVRPWLCLDSGSTSYKVRSLYF